MDSFEVTRDDGQQHDSGNTNVEFTRRRNLIWSMIESNAMQWHATRLAAAGRYFSVGRCCAAQDYNVLERGTPRPISAEKGGQVQVPGNHVAVTVVTPSRQKACSACQTLVTCL